MLLAADVSIEASELFLDDISEDEYERTANNSRS